MHPVHIYTFVLNLYYLALKAVWLWTSGTCAICAEHIFW